MLYRRGVDDAVPGGGGERAEAIADHTGPKGVGGLRDDARGGKRS